MSVKVNAVDPGEVTIEVNGKQHPIRFGPQNRFRYRYRSQDLAASTLTRIRSEIEALDADAADKRDRAKRLKAMEAEPEPAMRFLRGKPAQEAREARYPHKARPATPATVDRFERIGLRGADQRSGMALVTCEDGSKESIRWQDVLRVLSEQEQQEILSLAAQHDVLSADVKDDAVTYQQVADSFGEIEVAATYDSQTDSWMAEFDGVVFVGEGHSPLSSLEKKVVTILVCKTHPWVIAQDGATPLTEDHYGYSSRVFRTREDAEADIARDKQVEDARVAFKNALTAVTFDRSALTVD